MYCYKLDNVKRKRNTVFERHMRGKTENRYIQKTVDKMRTYSTREEIFYLLIRTYVSIVLYLNVWKHTDFSIINRYVDNNFHVSPTVNNATE